VARPQALSDLLFAEEAPPDSSRFGSAVVVRCGGEGALRPPPPSSRLGPRVPTLIGLGEEGDDFYSRKTVPNLRLPRWNLPREFQMAEPELTPEPIARAYHARAELVGRVKREPEARPQGIVAAVTAFIDALWQSLSQPVANK